MSYEEFQTITKLIVENCEPCKLNKVLSAIQNLIDEHEINDKKEKTIHFTKKEIESMPVKFKKEFRIDGCTARIYVRKESNHSTKYDIKYRRNGYNICATGPTLEITKERFLEKLKEADNFRKNSKNGVPIKLDEFTKYYFEKFRKRKVAPETLRLDNSRYKNYIKPHFNNKLIAKITPVECQNLIDKINEEGYGKTADEVYSLLSCIFKFAIANYIIEKNPLNAILHIQHERNHGTALTKEEEKKLLNETEGTDLQLMFAIALYTGMRPNEFETAIIEGNFIRCINSKRKNKKIEYKKIPITPMLQPYMQNIKELHFYTKETLREKIKDYLPNHILYDLRTTFYTRCTECGVADAARNEFVGHSLGVLGNTYTDLSDDFLYNEGQKINY